MDNNRYLYYCIVCNILFFNTWLCRPAVTCLRREGEFLTLENVYKGTKPIHGHLKKP